MKFEKSEPDVFLSESFASILSSWVDNKRPRQRPQFNYGHWLLRDLRNAGVHLKAWDTLAGDQNPWHAITQQKNVHCNAAGGDYAWLWAGASLMMLYIGALLNVMKLQMIAECFLQSIKGYLI